MSSAPISEEEYKEVSSQGVDQTCSCEAYTAAPLHDCEPALCADQSHTARLPASCLQIWAKVEAMTPEQRQRLRAAAFDQLMRRRRVLVDGKVGARAASHQLPWLCAQL
jgi:hypothetical protein